MPVEPKKTRRRIETEQEVQSHRGTPSSLANDLLIAYRNDPLGASKLWHELLKNANKKYYGAQVFKALTKIMPLKEAVHLAAIEENRIKDIFLHGLKGQDAKRLFESTFETMLSLHLESEALIALRARLESVESTEGSIFRNRTIVFAATACSRIIAENPAENDARSILQALQANPNQDLSRLAYVAATLELSEEGTDLEDLIFLERMCANPFAFFPLLWQSQDELDSLFMKNELISYLSICDENDVSPFRGLSRFPLQEKREIQNYLYWINEIKNDETILNRLFCRKDLHQIESDIMKSWTAGGHWEELVKYTSRIIIENSESTPPDGLVTTFSDILNAFAGGSAFGPFDESLSNLDNAEKLDFLNAVIEICNNADAARCGATLRYEIKRIMRESNYVAEPLENAIQQIDGSLPGPENELREYARTYIASKKEAEPARGKTKHDSLLRAVEEDDGRFEILPEDANCRERSYRWAKDPVLSQFFFEKVLSASCVRASMLSACLMNGDLDRAIDLTDSMPTHRLPGAGSYFTQDWGYHAARTFEMICHAYKTALDRDSSKASVVTDEMLHNFIALAKRLAARLPDNYRTEIENELLGIQRDENEIERYVMSTLDSLEDYLAEMQAGIPDEDHRSSEIELFRRVSRLSALGRLDALAFVLERIHDFDQASENAPILPRWAQRMIVPLPASDVVALFDRCPEYFESLLDSPSIDNLAILKLSGDFLESGSSEKREKFLSLVALKGLRAQ